MVRPPGREGADRQPSSRAVSAARTATVLTVAMAASTLVQFAIGALGPELTSYWGLSRVALGALTTVYYLTAAVSSPFAGRLTQRISAYPAIILLLLLNAIAEIVLAASPVYSLLFVGLVIAGVSAALGNPATNSALTGVVRSRGAIVGIKQSGVQFGGLLAGAIVPSIGLALGWRAAVLCCLTIPVIGLLTLPLRHIVGEHKATSRQRAVRPEAASAKVPPTVIWLAGYAACMGAGMSSTTTYLPLYSSQSLHFSVTTAGILLAVVAGAGVLARIGWSVLVDSGHSPGPHLVLAGMAGAAAIAMVVLNLALLAPGLAWVAAVLLGLTAAGWNGIVMLTLIGTLPSHLVSRASGIVQAGFFLGLGITPLIFGVVVDATGTYVPGWSVAGLVFLVATAITVYLNRTRRGASASDAAVVARSNPQGHTLDAPLAGP